MTKITHRYGVMLLAACLLAVSVACGGKAGGVPATATPSRTAVAPAPRAPAATAVPSTPTAVPATPTAAPSTVTPVAATATPASSSGASDTPTLPPCCKPSPVGPPSSPPGVTPAATVVPPGTIPAPIESATVRALESFPPRYALHVVAGLPSGCAKPGAADVTRSGNAFRVTVTDTLSSSGPCTMIYGTYELDVPLPGDFVSGAAYTVDVNGKQVSFTAR